MVNLLKVIFIGYARLNFKGIGQGDDRVLVENGITAEKLDFIMANAKAAPRYHKQQFRIVYDSLTTISGKTRWLDKLGGYVSQVDDMLAAIPDLKIIELVRDPRDILVSKRKRAADGEGFDPFWDTMAWRSSIQAGEAAQRKYPQQIIRVRYEDLVASPETAVPALCRFLGLEYNPEMLRVGWINTTQAIEGNNSGISTAAVGKWRHKLSPEAVSMCQLVAKTQIDQLGYGRMPLKIKTQLKLPLMMIKSGMEFFSRLYTRWRMGGTSYVFGVLSSYRSRMTAFSRR